MAKLSTQEIIDAIKELSVLELNDLVKACEEEFGVSAAAGVVVAAAGGAAASAEEEKTEFNVELSEENYKALHETDGEDKAKKKLVASMVTMLGIRPKINLLAPKSIVRSEGKAVRAIDKRKLHD